MLHVGERATCDVRRAITSPNTPNLSLHLILIAALKHSSSRPRRIHRSKQSRGLWRTRQTQKCGTLLVIQRWRSLEVSLFLFAFFSPFYLRQSVDRQECPTPRLSPSPLPLSWLNCRHCRHCRVRRAGCGMRACGHAPPRPNKLMSEPIY
jgi:hypothetical protein